MVGGDVMSRPDFRKMMEKLDYGDEDIAHWESDVRGEDTVQVAMYCHGDKPIMRWLYFSMRDGGECYRTMPPDFSRVIAEGWKEDMMDMIESGGIDRAQTYVQDTLMKAFATGRLAPPL
ncbi:hypothetical protein HWV62_28858 [Athelia sp. TMB]|nr:hypothetical protein HWV62_28858 [Athelia sp. TMB]